MKSDEEVAIIHCEVVLSGGKFRLFSSLIPPRPSVLSSNWSSRAFFGNRRQKYSHFLSI